MIKIPKYIEAHIEANNRLLMQATKHSEIVLDWYSEQLKILERSDSEIMENYFSNGMISLMAIKENFELLERK